MSTYGQRRGLVVFESGRATQPARDARGRYVSGGPSRVELRELNERTAKRFQASVVQTLQGMQWKRPNVSSGRLERATADTRNRFADDHGWGVGSPSFLDRSVAKYWRTIEEGSAATWSRGGMVGMKIYGIWGGSISGYYMNRWGLVPRAAGPWRAQAHRGKLRAFNAEFAEQQGIPAMTVEKEIEPHRYYESTIERFNPTREWTKRAQEILTESALRRLRGGPAGL